MITPRLVWLRMCMALLLVSAVLAAPALADEGKDEARGKERQESKAKGRPEGKALRPWGYDTYFYDHGYTTLNIPEGHLPPPGECRLWFPGQPPGHQPPPDKCGYWRAHVPAGAWLIHRPKDEPTYVDVSVYDAYRPGIVITIGIFAVDTSAFMRHVQPR
jgi:hypothetical protein